jgi:thiamine biosynthesis protein ThiI
MVMNSSPRDTDTLFLVKYGEIALKKRNRGAFVKSLKGSIRAHLPEVPFSVSETFHRVFIGCRSADRERVAEALGRTFGVVSFSEALRVPREIEAVEEAAIRLAHRFLAEGRGTRFKAEVRRAEKSFPMTSYEIACRIGDALRARFPELVVDVHVPDWVLSVEIREHAYLYGPQSEGPYGLPVGSSGKGMLLLSGGIDSPVAGWMMAKRGMALEAVYFHSPPFTSDKAREKVETLARILGRYAPGIVLHVVNFTPVLARIKEKAREEEVTLLLRACMMRFTSLLAERRGGQCLVTGESLGQVASQTVESIAFTGMLSALPVFRPLIGLNKEEIIAVARKIGTLETSNLPYEDCCVLFSPPHPLIHPEAARMRRAYDFLSVDAVLADALAGMDTVSAL